MHAWMRGGHRGDDRTQLSDISCSAYGVIGDKLMPDACSSARPTPDIVRGDLCLWFPRPCGPPDAEKDALVQGRPGRKRRPRGETPLLGVQLNDQIALGAEIALLRVGMIFGKSVDDVDFPPSGPGRVCIE